MSRVYSDPLYLVNERIFAARPGFVEIHDVLQVKVNLLFVMGLW